MVEMKQATGIVNDITVKRNFLRIRLTPYAGPFWHLDETTGRLSEDYSMIGISDPRARIEKI